MSEPAKPEQPYRSPRLLPFILWTYRHTWGWLLWKIMGKVRVAGRENVPRKGGLLILANHLSITDPPLTQFACPRRVYFLANREIFEWPEKGADGRPPGLGEKFSAWLARWHGAVPVSTNSADRAAIRRVVELLKAGEAVVVYPEGGTSPGGLQPLFSGPALMVRQAQVPVICLGIWGTDQIVGHQSFTVRRAKKPVVMAWGQARQFEPKASSEEMMAWVESELLRLSGLERSAPPPQADADK